jgi:hypothetical protein
MLKAESLLEKLESTDQSLLYVPRPWHLRVWTDEHAKADIVRSVNRGGDCEVCLLSLVKSCYVTHVKATDSWYLVGNVLVRDAFTFTFTSLNHAHQS